MKLTGELTEVDQWTMKTTFGTTNLPLSTVAGIRMAQEGNAMTTVVLHNGDNLTGAITARSGRDSDRMGPSRNQRQPRGFDLVHAGLKWSSETGLNGMRWKLVADEPAGRLPLPPRSARRAARALRACQACQPTSARPGTQPVFQPQPGDSGT